MTTPKILDTDIFANADPGLTFDSVSQTFTTTTGVLVSSSQNDGVFGRGDSEALFNNGGVLGGSDGVELFGGNSLVSNAANAIIVGVNDGVSVGGTLPRSIIRDQSRASRRTVLSLAAIRTTPP
jgi:hypothetical protein